MATNFPTSLDNLSNPQGTDSLAGHAALHGNVNDALEALQAKVGVNNSGDSNSIDYKISQLESQLSDLDSQSDSTLSLLGLDGNNDLPKPTRNSFGYYYDTTPYGVTSDSEVRLFYENASGFLPGSDDVNINDPNKLFYVSSPAILVLK